MEITHEFIERMEITHEFIERHHNADIHAKDIIAFAIISFAR